MKISKAARSLMLRIMLVTLVLDAALGIAVVLLEDNDLLAKAALTTLSLTISLGIVLAGSMATRTPRWAPFGLSLIASASAQFLCAIGLIWGEAILPSWFEDRMLATWALVFWFSIPACIALLIAGHRPTRVMGYTAAAGTILGCLLMLVVLWARWSTFQAFGLPVVAASAILVCSWCGAPSLIARHGRPAPWQYIGLALAAITATLWVFTAHLELNRNMDVWGAPILSFTVGFGMLTLLCGAIALCRAVPLPPTMNRFRMLTILVVALALACQEYTVIIGGDWPDDISTRVSIAAWILAACCLMALLIMGWKESWDSQDRQTGRTM
ncbi:MAG: hypothetical protein MK085_13115, partial [Phycisphaerales bacterium]|nr:hypothetical protein [Phycisphaerales bacterium]